MRLLAPITVPPKGVLAFLLGLSLVGSPPIPAPLFAGLYAGGLLLLLVSGREAMREGWRPSLLMSFGLVTAGTLLCLAPVVELIGGVLWPTNSGERLLSREIGVGGVLILATHWIWRRAVPLLPRGEVTEVLAPPPPMPKTTLVLVLLAWGAVHISFWLGFPPLLQIDSWANMWEPNLFEHREASMHHLPLYAVMVKSFASTGDPTLGIWILAGLQHLMVLLVAFMAERIVRLQTSSCVAAGFVGVGLAIDAQLTIYAQFIMTEITCLTLALGCLALLLESERSQRPLLMISLAGLCAAGAILTRQALQIWALLPGLWILLSRVRPRKVALAAFLGAAWGPLLFIFLHNAYYLGSPKLTEGGRFLIYRVALSYPEPTDAEVASEFDARLVRIIQEEKHGLYAAPYQRLEREFGWSEERITAEVKRLFIKLFTEHPHIFVGQGVEWSWLTFRGNGATLHIHGARDFHNKVRVLDGYIGWNQVPECPEPGKATVLWSDYSFSSLFLVNLLLLGLLIPDRRRSRGAALLFLLSIAYLVGLPCMLVTAAPRFRVPAIPFIMVAAGFGLAGLEQFARSLTSGRQDSSEAGPGMQPDIEAEAPPPTP